eukprot:tig00021123_g18487.t1
MRTHAAASPLRACVDAPQIRTWAPAGARRWMASASNDKKPATPAADLPVYEMTFVEKDGTLRTVKCKEGQSVLDIAHEHDVDLEGACEGSLACSTCHVVVDPKFFDKIPEATDEENDMLDLAFGLTQTSRLGSRLGCSVKMTRELDGLVVRLPPATRNMAVDGAKLGH